MTKVSVFGQNTAESKQLKPIEFVKKLGYTCEIEASVTEPKEWENVMLLERKYTYDGLDLMIVWDEDIDDKTIYLGHWNDGII